ncbi:MAG: lipopolysaccharide assembly protein LapA domain-containing protein [Idiomarina sp.]
MIRKLLVLIPVLVLFAIALAFGAQNNQVVFVDFFVVQRDVSVATLVALFVGAGFLFGVISMLASQWRLRLRVRRLRKQVQQLNKTTQGS